MFSHRYMCNLMTHIVGRKMKDNTHFTFLSLILWLLLCQETVHANPPKKPHIIIIMSDDMVNLKNTSTIYFSLHYHLDGNSKYSRIGLQRHGRSRIRSNSNAQHRCLVHIRHHSQSLLCRSDVHTIEIVADDRQVSVQRRNAALCHCFRATLGSGSGPEAAARIHARRWISNAYCGKMALGIL